MSTSPKSPLSIQREQHRGGFLVEIAGTLDDSFNRSALLEGLHGVVRLDLGRLHRITSVGVREWRTTLGDLHADYYGFVNCRPSVVAQFNMVFGFAGRG